MLTLCLKPPTRHNQTAHPALSWKNGRYYNIIQYETFDAIENVYHDGHYPWMETLVAWRDENDQPLIPFSHLDLDDCLLKGASFFFIGDSRLYQVFEAFEAVRRNNYTMSNI